MQKSKELIESLIAQTEDIIRRASELQELGREELTLKADPQSWSILECLEHLNLYGDFYLPQMEQKINAYRGNSAATFKSGWLGDYFAKSMLPKEKLNKMKTFRDKNPLNADLGKDVIDRFLEQQSRLIRLLRNSARVDLNKVKIPTSISPLIRMKLGDTFRFIINHNIRHMQQIDRLRRQGSSALT